MNWLRIVLLASLYLPGHGAAQTLSNPWWEIGYGPAGIHELGSPADPYGANLLNGSLGVDVRFQVNDGDWNGVFPSRSVSAAPSRVCFTDYEPGMPFSLVQDFRLDGEVLEWTIELENRRAFPVRIGDLSIQVPWRTPSGPDPASIFERGFTKHQFISGDGSFLLFTRANGEPPYLLLTVKPGTSLEYFTSEGAGTFRAYIHSAYSGGGEARGSWRQAHTGGWLDPRPAQGDAPRADPCGDAVRMAATPAGDAPGHVRTYGFRLRWVGGYDEVRDRLAEERLLDVRVVPGMTVPEDVEARFTLHSAAPIDSVVAEHPDRTRLRHLGEPRPGHHLYAVRFARLGENLLTVHFDGRRRSYLEFFVTEPVATLLEKRSRFVVERQQHRDPALWYDGLFSIWDMKNRVLRGPDDADGYDWWWGYMVASDDPILGIAPYLASVNALFPEPRQIEALEYHLERFVWGGLQRTDQDDPFPYAIYGVPNWKVARSDSLRAQIENRRLDRPKIWRAYDYPHLFMLYYHMFQIAERYPDLVRYLDADGYFERMWQTARAFFIIPYQVYPWYDIYKWGFYNELLVPDIIGLLEERGRQEDADWLRGEWEKKVKYFVYQDPYPYRSEYPFDRTAFESTYALARYGATRDMEPDENLWWDRNEERWHSHPEVSREAALDFMERQHRAGLAIRGWVTPTYYLLGSDFGSSPDRHALSYMARMGGWSILDYGLRFASEPWDWLQLGYASYLSAFALMNTGRPDTGYGYWFPGETNDGALGWAFMSAKHGRAWIRKDEDRGPWRYDGEANLGMGAVTRMASTILARDPLFGWFGYGAELEETPAGFRLWPRDGVRTRFWLVDTDHRVGLELERDGWSATEPIVVSPDRRRIELTVENRTAVPHAARLLLDGAGAGDWTVVQDGRTLRPEPGRDGFTYRIEMTAAEHTIVLERR
jgi:hypothetical protein